MEVRDVENLPAELQAVAFPRHLPALAQGHIQTGVAGEVLALAERQLGNPVEIDLVGGVEIRHSPAPVRIESIRQASSGRSYVATRCPRETSRGRGDIDRPGIRVVEVELHSTAELLPKGGLKRVVI